MTALALTAALNRPIPEVTPSLFHTPPFFGEQDFESYALMGREDWTRSRVTYGQKHALMAAVVTLLRETCGAEMVVTSRMPAVARMPDAMLGEDIVVVMDVATERDAIAAEGRSVIGVEEGFARHPLERGDNRLRLTWANPPADGAARLAAVAAALPALGLEIEP